MKKLIALLLVFICLCGCAIGDSPATPTDLEGDYVEFEEDDYGEIDPSLLPRTVFLEIRKEPEYYGDEIELIAVLINFLPTDICIFNWEYSEDQEEWITIADEHEQTYKFILDHTNVKYWWRVTVTVQEG